jgi:predicted kinase
LRPEHICLEQPPQIIDCIEFSEEYRRLDVADEVCFLAMECERLGADAFAKRLIERCQEQSQDTWPGGITEFYTAYRACVRAKVTALRAAQLAETLREKARLESMQYLEFADRRAGETSTPLLIVVGGLMGTGKSTLASALASRLGADVLQTDAVRRQLFGTPEQNATYGEGVYGTAHRARVYDRLFELAARQLSDRLSIILDGTFLSAYSKERARDLAEVHGANATFLKCTCPQQTALARIARRLETGESLSDARPDLLELQRQEEQPPPTGLVQFEIDTVQPLETQLSNACRALTGNELAESS